MTDFGSYYKLQFRHDLLSFVAQIPSAGNKHYKEDECTIQYFI